MNKPPNLRNEPTCNDCIHGAWDYSGDGMHCKKHQIYMPYIIYRCDDLELKENPALGEPKFRKIINPDNYTIR